jgi:AraC-like DNA-binding protein
MRIRAEVRTYKETGGRHNHPFAQVIVPLSGAMEIEVEGRGERLTTSVFGALDVHATHDFFTVKDARFLVFDIDQEILVENTELVRGLPFQERVRTIDPRAFRFLRYYAAELQHCTLPDQARQLLALSGLALLAEAPGGEPLRKHAARIAAAARWIEDHSTSGNSVTGLAARFALSRSHFVELFQRELGRSPKQYEIDIRMARAVELLLRSGRSISEIAFEVGYLNVSAFTRTFTRHFGSTPGSFRNSKK